MPDAPTRPSLMPADTPDYMAPAWAGCLAWAARDPGVIAAFRAETGNAWQPGRTPMERAVDEATGASDAFMQAFVAWFNRAVWGPMEGEGDDA